MLARETIGFLWPLRYAVKLEPVIDQLETQFLGHATLQLFNFLIDELDYPPGRHIDQVIMMLADSS